mmetsp:Transcript_48601/g.114039  ORF Transcript_48601/g.114039 Transcript_48601/m.114039 type:complete len:540 (+) Transcript_48601:1219-2838(+)
MFGGSALSHGVTTATVQESLELLELLLLLLHLVQRLVRHLAEELLGLALRFTIRAKVLLSVDEVAARKLSLVGLCVRRGTDEIGMKSFLQEPLLDPEHDVLVLLIHLCLELIHLPCSILLLCLRKVCDIGRCFARLAICKLPQRRQHIVLLLPSQDLLLLLLEKRQTPGHLRSRNLRIFARWDLLDFVKLRRDKDPSCAPLDHFELEVRTGVNQNLPFTFCMAATGVQWHRVGDADQVRAALGPHHHILKCVDECVAAVSRGKRHLVELISESVLVVGKPVPPRAVHDIGALANRDAKVADHRDGPRKHACLSQEAHLDGVHADKIRVGRRARQDRPSVLSTVKKACCADLASSCANGVRAHNVCLIVAVHFGCHHVRQDHRGLCISRSNSAAVRRLESLSLDEEDSASKHGGVLEVKQPSQVGQYFGILEEYHNIAGLALEVQTTREVVWMVVLKQKLDQSLRGRAASNDGVAITSVLPALDGISPNEARFPCQGVEAHRHYPGHLVNGDTQTEDGSYLANRAARGPLTVSQQREQRH